MDDKLQAGGFFTFECFNPDGSLAWREMVHNGVTTSGLNDLLSVAFAAGTQKAAWYFGLIDNVGYSALSGSDTIASHSGWTENTDYSESTRQQWSPGAPSGGVITNPTVATFTINASVTIKGAFLVSNNTKGGTTGQLWATGEFSSNQVLGSGQTLKLTYTLTATAS